jgi:GNAT superfamily N-acetyltransferase
MPIVHAVPDPRPMREDDVVAARELMVSAFGDLARRMHEPVPPAGDPAPGYVRLRRVLASDPAGSWVTQDRDGALTGVALAIMRDGVWGLSLLVVRPDLQSAGIGSALLRKALEYGADARGAIILASPDARALRAYSRAGFALHPTVAAAGTPRDVAPAPAVRAFTAADHPLAAAVDRALRGAAHGADLDALAEGGCELLTYPERGYAVHRRGEVVTLAAFDEEAAAALLRTVLARAPAGGKAEVDWLTGSQQWAIDVAVAARLELRVAGAVFLRGDVGPFRPYLPGGAYL